MNSVEAGRRGKTKEKGNWFVFSFYFILFYFTFGAFNFGASGNKGGRAWLAPTILAH
jgi:hypothetical protein